jgi:hypothetical protein
MAGKPVNAERARLTIILTALDLLRGVHPTDVARYAESLLEIIHSTDVEPPKLELTDEMVTRACIQFDLHEELLNGATGTWKPEWTRPTVQRLLEAALGTSHVGHLVNLEVLRDEKGAS